jgi:hypothetical protein
MTTHRKNNEKKIKKKTIFTFFILSPLILDIINKNTALLKEKKIPFSPVRLKINIIQPFQRKKLSNLAPASVPFNPIFFFFFQFFLFTFY